MIRVPRKQVLLLGGLPFVEHNPKSGSATPKSKPGKAKKAMEPPVVARDCDRGRGALRGWMTVERWHLKSSPYYRVAERGDDERERLQVDFVGLEDGPLDGVVIPCELRFPETFPDSPPEVFSLRRVVHPNISAESGAICAPDSWLPIHELEEVALSVLSTLTWPNCDCALNWEAAGQFLESPRAFWLAFRQSLGAPVEW
jgi:ubiquitin-protein ligase